MFFGECFAFLFACLCYPIGKGAHANCKSDGRLVYEICLMHY